MELEINVISITNAISAEEAKLMAKQYHEAEMKKDVDAILNCLGDEPWKRIRAEAMKGNNCCYFTIGYDNGNTCRIREHYGWAWLHDKGEQFITNLFSSFGYKVTYDWHTPYVRIDIKWAE